MDREGAYEGLLGLHDEVDAASRALAVRHAARLECGRGCAACCVDGLTVFEVEAERLRRAAAEVLDQAPGPTGACAFLDEDGACRAYADRIEEDGEEVVERRTICELNAEGPPLEGLDEDEVWLVGPVELRLQQLQQRFGGDQARVALRELFRK